MKENSIIYLSDDIAFYMKYIAPFIIAFVCYNMYIEFISNKYMILTLVIIGIIYWCKKYIPIKKVSYNNRELIVSNGSKKLALSIDELIYIDIGTPNIIDTGITTIYLKNNSIFGRKIIFYPKRDLLKIEPNVKKVLEGLNKIIELKNDGL